jgi:hypothetical protein
VPDMSDKKRALLESFRTSQRDKDIRHLMFVE